MNKKVSNPQIVRHNRDLDPIGSVLLGLSVLGVLFPFLEARAGGWVWIALPVGVIILAIWVWWERRYKRRGRNPMVDLAIFRVRSFSNGTVLVTLYFMGMTSIWVLMALYMQEGLGHNALAAGFIGMPAALVSLFSALWAGKLVSKHGRGIVILGLYVGLLGLAMCFAVVWLHATGTLSEWWLLLSLSFVGFAQGSVISPNQTLTLADVPLEYAGSSGGIMQTGQRVGTAMGIAFITALAFSMESIAGWSVALDVSLVAIFVMVALALVVAYLDKAQRKRSGRASPVGD